MARPSKPRKTSKKPAAKPRRAKPAAAGRARRKPARAAKPARETRPEPASDLVYSDIRRSMAGAILKHLR
jgi:hypothetical protein